MKKREFEIDTDKIKKFITFDNTFLLLCLAGFIYLVYYTPSRGADIFAAYCWGGTYWLIIFSKFKLITWGGK